MAYDFVFSREQQRIIQAVMIDSRKTSMPIGINGNQIKPLVDAQVALVTDTVIFYKVETIEGNLAGYFSLQVDTSNKSATQLQFLLRPAFQVQTAVIQQHVNNFIISGDWKGDFLFSS